MERPPQLGLLVPKTLLCVVHKQNVLHNENLTTSFIHILFLFHVALFSALLLNIFCLGSSYLQRQSLQFIVKNSI